MVGHLWDSKPTTAISICVALVTSVSIAFAEKQAAKAGVESDYYRIVSVATTESPTGSRSKKWKPAPDGLALEVSGLEVLDNQRVAVAIRKGEIWMLEGVYDDPPRNVRYSRFASALHEPLGLIRQNEVFYTAQRSELTGLRDTDNDGVADEYLTVAKGWGVTGNYHEYAFGPELDPEGNLWITLNIGMGFNKVQRARTLTNGAFGYRQARWRGWGMKVTPGGKLIPVCAGMRSPCGLGSNADGDMFYTDQQGNWVATNSLHHMREGAFFHHAESLASRDLPGSPLSHVPKPRGGLPYPEAVRANPFLKPPAVWFPYKKAGQSATDILLDGSGGAFGPFSGQLFVGEFTQASIHRVFLEKIDGEYQGACFPFRSRFASAVLRLAQGTDGSLFVGLTNRGWSSLGTASYGLQRLQWTGRTPFEILEMRARPWGFEVRFTKPVDRGLATDVRTWAMNRFTYLYHATYGSDEIQNEPLTVTKSVVSDDGQTVQLHVDGCRELFVHELLADHIRSESGEPLLHPQAWYTLNQIPQDGPP